MNQTKIIDWIIRVFVVVGLLSFGYTVITVVGGMLSNQ